MDLDEVLEEIGEFGRYQKTNYFLICLPVMFAAAKSLLYVFTAGTPPYRCLIPECEDRMELKFNEEWLSNAIPSRSREQFDEYLPEPCLRFMAKESLRNAGNDGSCSKEMFFRNITESCSEWVFDNTEKTIVEELGLTCPENAWKLAFVGTTHFAGLVVGTALTGMLADRYGRKNILITCITVMAISGIAQGLAWDYVSFLIFGFLNALGTSGVYPLAFIIGVEMVGRKKRELSSVILNYFYAVGEASVGIVAWLLHDWRLMQFVLSTPPLIFFAYYWLIPESVRWLIAKKKAEKAVAIIHKAAKVNRKKISTGLLIAFSDACHPSRTSDHIDGHNRNRIITETKAVFKSKTLLLRYAIMMHIWAVNAIVYYGLSLNSTNLSGNKYLNFILVCLIEIPGYALLWIFLNKFGRKVVLSSSLFLCAVTCIAGGFVIKGPAWLIISLFLTGKLGITASFAIVYTYTSEIMPTIIRSGGVGCMATFGRFGAMVAPFVPMLSSYFEALPLLVFGTLSFSAGMLTLCLPETFRKRLPDTVEEAKLIGKEPSQKFREEIDMES